MVSYFWSEQDSVVVVAPKGRTLRIQWSIAIVSGQTLNSVLTLPEKKISAPIESTHRAVVSKEIRQQERVSPREPGTAEPKTERPLPPRMPPIEGETTGL